MNPNIVLTPSEGDTPGKLQANFQTYAAYVEIESHMTPGDIARATVELADSMRELYLRLAQEVLDETFGSGKVSVWTNLIEQSAGVDDN